MNASSQQRVRRPRPAAGKVPGPRWRFRSSLASVVAGGLAAMLFATVARAVVSEPDNVVYGTIALGTTPVTAADTAVVVEARRTPPGPAVASYRMGDDPAANAGNFYLLRLGLESGAPVADPSASAPGDTLYLVVLDASGVRDQKMFTLGPRGQITRIDFGNIDTDHNGLPDEWERSHFGAIGQNPNADFDKDGLTNLQEYQRGTDPKVPDAPHPADSNPTDYAVSITEVTAYGLAWKLGHNWPGGPNPVPIDYVTRAGTLWKGGELYKQDLAAASAAPLWWVNVTGGAKLMSFGDAAKPGQRSLASPTAATTESQEPTARRALPAFFDGANPITVMLTVAPGDTASAYAVEETPPAGWSISDVSDDGQFIAATGTVRWGPFCDAQTRSLSYVLTPATSGLADLSFAGMASFDGASLTIGGAASLSLVPGANDTAARFTGVQFSAASGFHAVLRGVPGQTYQLEVSTDLNHWSPLLTQTAGANGNLAFTDPAAGAQARFYRAQAQ